jgi:hypothetical protein
MGLIIRGSNLTEFLTQLNMLRFQEALLSNFYVSRHFIEAVRLILYMPYII